MSASVGLQDIILARLRGSDAVAALVGQKIYDGVPTTAAYPYVSLGATDLRLDDADCVSGREETVQIDCWSQDNARLWPCKALVDSVVRALVKEGGDADEIPDGFVLEFRLELARVFLDADAKTAHGVVQVTAIVEEID
ncbi:DUF3168 domain-containing protein [Rhizobium sp. CC-YZS058]|uniref:DUF3168 domain-containing protein n=1 Tax=Rhizobium sp. CC-YZS058 TaxID=3042153 RepID=UPI002B060EEF|nr:DUF3168 domain-containing protein [Rhizobium sp. CC-YZS058]MEA3534280.1 DUF3168 domain-containing protein [Rhizobium sp. CC-YZS058]